MSDTRKKPNATHDSPVNDRAMNLWLESVEPGSASAGPLQEDASRGSTASLTLLSTILESTADGIVALDLAGRIVAYNSKFANIWHFPDAVLQRRDGREMKDFAAQQCQDPEKFLQIAAKHLSQPDREILDLLELKDGRTFERHGFPQNTEERCSGVVITFREVINYKQAQTALRRCVLRYRINRRISVGAGAHDAASKARAGPLLLSNSLWS